jgi:hypothetical protein
VFTYLSFDLEDGLVEPDFRSAACSAGNALNLASIESFRVFFVLGVATDTKVALTAQCAEVTVEAEGDAGAAPAATHASGQGEKSHLNESNCLEVI